MAEKLPIDQSIIDRVVSGVKYVITGVKPDSWFGPNQPVSTVAPVDQKGRQYDYETAHNIRLRKRQGEGNYGATYDDLRNLADTHDLTRLAIETKKDQISRLKWEIRYKDGREDDAKVEAIREFLEYPDRTHSHAQWLRMMLEDILVVDCTAIYPRMTRGGDVYSLDQIDPTTINRMIDESGRTPMAPDVAYQQILKGVPAFDFSADELYYTVRNPRTNKLYGMSQVEQIIITVNTALRRQSSQLDYFTSGTVPDAIMEAPAEWSPDQIRQFQEYFDSILEGNTSERRKVRMVPSGAKFTTIKGDLLKDEFDEWLAKIVCYAFSISPQALIKQMNKASAEVSVDTAEAEGLYAITSHVAEIHNYIIRKYFGIRDIEFVWASDESEDVLKQAQVDQIYINTGVLLPEQVAEMRGFQYVKREEPVQPEPQQISEKMAKSDPREKMDAIVNPVAYDMETELGKILAEAAEKVAASVSLDTDLTKADAGNTDDLINEYMMQVHDIVETSIIVMMDDVVAEALVSIDIDDIDVFNQAHKAAIEWAHDRAAELVGKKWVNGELIDNPNQEWSITQTTRDIIRRQVELSITNGDTVEQLREAVRTSHAFSMKRAKMIAQTETVTAYNGGSFEAYKASGVVIGKRSILGTNENHGEDDIANAAQGVIPLEQPFQSGHQHPSYHPDCHCTISPVVKL